MVGGERSDIENRMALLYDFIFVSNHVEVLNPLIIKPTKCVPAHIDECLEVFILRGQRHAPSSYARSVRCKCLIYSGVRVYLCIVLR